MTAKKLTLILVAMVFLAAGTAVAGVDVAKIGVVDLQRILNDSVAGKDASAELKDRGEQMQKDLQKKSEEWEQKRSALERGFAIMNEDTREEKQRELRIARNDLEVLRKRYTEEIKRQEAQLMKGILDQVMAMVEDIGRTEGYILIVDKSEGGTVYYPSSIEITDRIIKEFDAKYEKEKKK